MRLTALYVGLSLALAAQANWFGGDSHSTNTGVQPYSTWSASQLRDWLDIHSIPAPSTAKTEHDLRDLVEENWNTVSTWTYDQYASAQKAFTDLRDTSFDKWDESQLRQFLLEQGVVAPKGPKEKLVLMAKERYRAYTNAANQFGAKTEQVSQSLASAAAQATNNVARVFDETKDYVYSTWDENQLRSWLEKEGLLKTKEQKKKDELLGMVHHAWGRIADPVWNAWSDSYMHHWLEAHNIVKSEPKNTREYLVKQMQQYYYTTNDRIWNSWSDSQLKQWLVDRGIVKSDAEVSREKMLTMVQDNYLTAKDTFWNAWTDNQLHTWLVDNGYLRTDAQKKRDELIKLAEEKYSDVNAKTASYLVWPDARLRAYLREHGLSEEFVPGDRPGLLQETRIRWVQAEHGADSILEKVRELVNNGAHKVEDVLANVLNILTTGLVDVRRNVHEDFGAAKEGYDDIKRRTDQEYEHAKRSGEKGYAQAKRSGEKGYDQARARAADSGDWAEEKWEDAREYTGEKVKKAGKKIKGEL
ncbi:hypothetical protein FA15DRAFT_640498 [Coprinopsis marcescibilis]|uniref:Meiotic sister chromatid recombination protein 1 n=1 Tax=Coprinopsis marcescibilis TaxID=230819 RepID=A0A5C3KW32_COPMA|nr:hypothetical protein FA15DRAFT_640498 [Coprinopsis marcescibilis]